VSIANIFQAEEAGSLLSGRRNLQIGNGAAPPFALSHEANPWTLHKSSNAVEDAVGSGVQDMAVKDPANTQDEPQPLLEAFEAEMAKILEASASQASERSIPETVEDRPAEPDSNRHPKPGDVLTHALKNLAGGMETLGSELMTKIPELERHLSYAQRALPEHVGSTFQATLATVDSHIKNLANAVQDASVATGRAADRVRQAEVRSAEQMIDRLGKMAGEFGQFGWTLFSAFEEEFTRRSSTSQTENPAQPASSSQEEKSQADPIVEKKEPVADAISSTNVGDPTASHAAHSDGEVATRQTKKAAAPHPPKQNTTSPEVSGPVSESDVPVGAHIHPHLYKRQHSFGPMPLPTWGQFSNWPNRPAIIPPLPSRPRSHLAPIRPPHVPTLNSNADGSSLPSRPRSHLAPIRPPRIPSLNSNADGSPQGPTVNRMVQNQSSSESSRAVNDSLFIGNVGFNVTEKMIEDVFASKGFLAQVHLPANSETGRHAGFGYAHFRSTHSARAALEALQGAHVDGHSINLEFSDNSPIDTLQSPTRVSDRGTNPPVASPAPTTSAEEPSSSQRLRHRQSWHPASRRSEQTDPRRVSFDMTPTSRRATASNLEHLFYQRLPSNPLPDAEMTRQSETRNASNALLDQSEETAEFAARYPSLLPSRESDVARAASSVPDRLLTLSPNSEMERFPPVSQLDAHILASQYGISRPRPADSQAGAPRARRQDNTDRQVIFPPNQPEMTSRPETEQAPEQPSITAGSNFESRGPQQTEEIAHQHGRRRQRRSRPLMRIASAARLTGPFNPVLPHMAPAADRPLRRSATEVHPLRRRAREHALASRPLSFSERERDRTIPGSFPADEPAPAANGEYSLDADMQVAIQRSIIDNCVDTLVSLGYGTERDGGRQRLSVYAEAVGGNVPNAVEMIEEDRSAHAQHDSSAL
jgi:RNA recognition motif-containing protein/uncharacterized protein YukE